MLSAYEKTKLLQQKMVKKGLPFDTDFFSVQLIRRAAIQLHRWCELECGDGNSYSSWCIDRDEKTGLPYMEIYPNHGPMRRFRIADREKGALKRIKKICQEKGLFFYYQTDPRGCALYINNEPLTQQNYNNGVAICI